MKFVFITCFSLFTSIGFAQSSGGAIVGGYPVDIKEAPYIVSVENLTLSSQHRCGGTIIADRWVLTAAHCIGTLTASDLMVHAGATDQTNNNIGQRIPVQTIYVHPSYTDNATIIEHDIALLYLSQPLVYNYSVQPLEYATTCNSTNADVSPNLNKTSFLTGWGWVQNSSNQPSANLRGIDLSIISNSLAYGLNVSHNSGNTLALTSNMLSFWDYSTNSPGGSAHGDSGGPAVMDINGNNVQVGVSSWGYSPFDKLPSIYVNLRNYQNWIETTTGIVINPSGQDLYTKDRSWDMGFAPFNDLWPWNSEDIWIRRQNDGVEKHQNPEYSSNPGQSNYIYVKVRNRGCTASQGTEELKLYWTKGATGISWPDHWDGSRQTSGGHPLGGLVGQVTLPVIQPGEVHVAVVPYQPVDPANYANLWSDPLLAAAFSHHFCLLSRIESPYDPMTTTETSDVIANTSGNNNIAWRNITVVDVEADGSVGNGGFIAGGGVLIGATSEAGGTYDIEFSDYLYSENSITSEAEITITLDGKLWDDWESNGFQGSGLGAMNDENHEVILTSSPAVIGGLSFDDNERKMIHVNFNMLSDDYTQKEEFEYQVIQKETASDEIIGGEVYKVIVPMRPHFDADAGSDEEILKGDSVQLTGADIGESAIYNWYDDNDELIATGNQVWLSPEVSTLYTLEVIATTDGFKDYDEIYIEVKTDYFVSAIPNPVSEELNVNYVIDDEASTANILLFSSQEPGLIHQYSIDPRQTSTTIDVTNFSSGLFYMLLEVDGGYKDQLLISVQ